jgi:hypothetical protein
MSKIIKNSNAIGGSLFFTGSITETLGVSQNNYSIGTLDNFVLIRLNATANINITGLVPPDIALGWYILIYNVSSGANSITIKNNDAASSASNRFLLGNDKNLQPDEGIALVYDTVSQRWRSFGINI